MDAPVLGIDFGTTQSSAVLITEDGRILRIKDPVGTSWSIPTAVTLDRDGRFVVGTAATWDRFSHPGSYVENFKRGFADAPEQILTLGASDKPTEVTPRTLARLIFEFIREQAETLSASSFGAVEIGCPAQWEEPLRETLRGEAIAAGFSAEAVHTTPEPVAAARHALTEVPGHESDVIMLYDFGGGTVDVALLRVLTEGDVEVLGYGGVSKLGGMDVDARVLTLFTEESDGRVAQILQQGSTASSDLSAQGIELRNRRLDILHEARRVKHELSSEESVYTEFTSDDGPIPITLSRNQLEQRVEPLLSEALDSCQRVLDDAGIGSDRLARIITVGGSSRMPIVRRALETRFRRPVSLVSDPELAIAQGAAMFARDRAQHPDRTMPDVYGGGTVPMGWRADETTLDGQFIQAAFFLGETLWERERPHEAEQWYELAAKAHHRRAAYQMGWLRKYQNDYESASYWWEKAASKGEVEAAYYLGELLWEMNKPELAEPWFVKSVRGGHAHAAYQLGWLHRIRGDLEQARTLYKRASTQGDFDAAAQLGALLEEATEGDGRESGPVPAGVGESDV